MHEHLIEGGTIRKLWITEAPLYCAHLLRLDPESRRDRFNGTVSDAYIRSFAAPSNFADAVVHGFFGDGVLRGVGELRPLVAYEAEIALSVEQDWQGHGVGAALVMAGQKLQEFGLPEERIFNTRRNYHARMASFALLSNQRIVSRSPSRRVIFARQPNSASAREVSRQRRGWPSGFDASQRMTPS